MDGLTALVTVCVALIGGVPATIAAVGSWKTHTQVTRNSHRDPEKPTLPDRVSTVGSKVDGLHDDLGAKVDELREVVLGVVVEQKRQGNQLRALWAHVRRPDDTDG